MGRSFFVYFLRRPGTGPRHEHTFPCGYRGSRGSALPARFKPLAEPRLAPGRRLSTVCDPTAARRFAPASPARLLNAKPRPGTFPSSRTKKQATE